MSDFDKEEMKTEIPDEAPEKSSFPETEAEEQAGSDRGNRSHILWLIAGAYLVYTGFTLCKNVVQGVEGSKAIFMVVGIFFMAFGAFLCVMGLKGIAQKDKGNPVSPKAQIEAARKKASEEETSDKMSISQKARMVETLGDVNTEEETAEESDTTTR